MKNKTIITADDHPLLLKGLNDFLLEKKYKVIGSGNNGEEAYNLIVKESPDIAILDIQMPIMTGLDVAKKCKTNNIKTKIIWITFHKEKVLFQKANELNTDSIKNEIEKRIRFRPKKFRVKRGEENDLFR